MAWSQVHQAARLSDGRVLEQRVQMMEVRSTAEVDPSLRSRGSGRGLEGVLVVSYHLCDLLEKCH